MRVPLAQWMPDIFGLENQGTVDAKNVIPKGSGYIPIQDMVASSTALNGIAQGAFTAEDANGDYDTFAGTSNKLYLLSAGTFSDVSVAGGYHNTGRWNFAQFGQYVIATNISDALQYYLLGSSTLFAPVSSLGDTPPQARYVARIRDFLVLGNTSNSPQEVYWSGFNNLTNWTIGVNQSDSQTIQDGGWVQGITSGDVGYVFQEKAINRMTYVGPPLYFQFDVLEVNRGVAAPGSLIKIGSVSYFLDQDGFYAKDGDAQSVPIGFNQVNSWFQQNIEPQSYDAITASYDPVNQLVLWSFVSTSASNTNIPDTVLIYNRQKPEWSYAKIVHQMIYRGTSPGWTLEQVGNAYPNLDTLVPASLDSRIWVGGLQMVGIFNSSNQLCTLSGPNLAASVTTADMEPVKGRRSFITNVRPFSDTNAVTAVMESRERFADGETNTSVSSMQPNGDIPLLSSGRFHRANFQIPYGSSWTFINGADVDAQDDGEI